MNKYYMEQIFRFYCSEDDDYYWELSEDPDGLGYIEIKHVVYNDEEKQNKITNIVSFPSEIVDNLINALGQYKQKLNK